MTLARSRIVTVVQRKLSTTLGRRFSRFVPVAIASFAASEIVLIVCVGPAHQTAGISAVVAWFAGAAVSYVLSRWAWERKGRPDLLKETIPFWAISVAVVIVLTTSSKWANHEALSMGLGHLQRTMFVAGAYFVANCVTFVCRFVIFHYVLFTDRRSKAAAAAGAEPNGAAPAGAEPGAAAPSDVPADHTPATQGS